MSEGGTVKARLEDVTRKLDEELELWKQHEITHTAFRLGDRELDMLIHINAIVRMFKEHMGISEDQLNLIYKEEFLKSLQNLRPVVVEGLEQAKRQAIQEQLTKGIFIRPPENKDGNGI